MGESDRTIFELSEYLPSLLTSLSESLLIPTVKKHIYIIYNVRILDFIIAKSGHPATSESSHHLGLPFVKIPPNH